MAKILLIIVLVLSVILAIVMQNIFYSSVQVIKPDENQFWGPGSPKEDTIAIRTFKINISEANLIDLNERLERTRALPKPLEGIHFEYGFNSETLEKIIKFWRFEYNWREREVFLNSLPQFKTQIQGLDIHFIRVKPKLSASIKRTIPLLLLHGWPGSFREFYPLIPFLTANPPQDQDFVFEVIVPSLPGYGFSESASKPGLGAAHMGIILKNLMQRLGHDKFYIQGGDWGSQVATNMGVFYPDNVMGLHLNLCGALNSRNYLKIALGALVPGLIVDQKDEFRLYPLGERFMDIMRESGYFHIQATKPDTIGVGLVDSPAGLAAYILEKFSTGTNGKYRSIKDGGLLEKFTYTDLLDNVMIYWVTGSMTTAMRLYAESTSKKHKELGVQLAEVQVPTWCSKFLTEVVWMPDWMLKSKYPKLMRSFQYDFGGHFAAMENPKILANDIWNAFIEAENMLQNSKN